MAFIKVPSWFDVLHLGLRQSLLKKALVAQEAQEQSFWKEQALRFGFDIRAAKMQNGHNLLDSPWQSFFFEKFFQYTLRRIGNSLQNLKNWEKSFWKRNGRFVERLELSSISSQDLKTIIRWFPNLKWLTLNKCHSLLQANASVDNSIDLSQLKKLTTLQISDAHFLSAKAFHSIPEDIQTLIIDSARGFGSDFFEKLAKLDRLNSLIIRNCQGLQLHFLRNLPKSLRNLDLSGSGKSISNEALLFLPSELETLKLNKWDHFGDKELELLPAHVRHLEVEGWDISPSGLQQLEQLPLESLSLAASLSDPSGAGLIFLPRTLKKLDLSQNHLTSDALSWLDVLESLEELHVAYAAAFGSKFDDEPIFFPTTLKTLNLSYSGPFHKKTVQHFKACSALKSLSLAGCAIENHDLEYLPEQLEELNLCLSSDLTDVALSILKGLKALSSLELDGCEQIRGFGLSHLSSHLKKLSLAGCNRLSGKSLVNLPENLEELTLDCCELVTNHDIISLPLSLHVLSLAYCPHISNEAIDYISGLPLLNTITLTGCNRVCDQAISKLVRRKFEGTIVIKSDIELHPPASMLKKLTNFKARLLHKLKSQALR